MAHEINKSTIPAGKKGEKYIMTFLETGQFKVHLAVRTAKSCTLCHELTMRGQAVLTITYWRENRSISRRNFHLKCLLAEMERRTELWKLSVEQGKIESYEHRKKYMRELMRRRKAERLARRKASATI